MSAERLSRASLGSLPAAIQTPAYDLDQVRIGVIHLGPGAFHRAHQAHYFDEMLRHRPDFGVCAVALHSRETVEGLAGQDGLYTLVEQSAQPTLRVIGAIRRTLHAPSAPEAVLDAFRTPSVRFVTATVTEKGYCLNAAGDLDLDHPDIRADLTGSIPKGFVGWLAAGLAARKAAGLTGLTVLSCDNLTDNGPKLRQAVLQLVAARGGADLGRWIEREVAFPATMVDSITPATDGPLRDQVGRALGVHDGWPVQRERFIQWVVGDGLRSDREAFETAGVTITADVAAFERAKLRLLNGAHSTLAYVGLALGHATVAEAMADAALARFIERMMREDIAPTLGLDVDNYIADVLERFRNPAIVHNLSQIAWDGSQKLPVRLLGTIANALAAGRPVDRLAAGVAAWMHFVCERARRGEAITDPMAARLLDIGATADPQAFLHLREVFPPAMAADPPSVDAVLRAFATLEGPSSRDVLGLG